MPSERRSTCPDPATMMGRADPSTWWFQSPGSLCGCGAHAGWICRWEGSPVERCELTGRGEDVNRPTGIAVFEFVDARIDDVTVTAGNTALVNPATVHWQRAFELSRLVF